MAWQGRQNQWLQPEKQWQWYTQQSTVAPAWRAAPQAEDAAGYGSSSSYVFVCEGPDAQEVVVKTLMGEYVEHGSNHGRKVYKKVAEPSPDFVDVHMYYWDGRDGPAFQGWWLGNQLGGTQVWSHNVAEDYEPPVSGWKIPWDGEERASVSVSPKEGGAQAYGQGYAQAPMQNNNQGAANQVDDATMSAKQALQEVATMAGDYSDPDAIKQAEQFLLPQVSKLNEALKALMGGQRGGDAGRQIASMGQQVRTMQLQVNAELSKLKQAKMKADLATKKRDAEVKDMATLEALLPEAEQKCNIAGDCVEKAVITTEVIAAAGDDMEQVEIAVSETEKAIQEAQKALGEARIYINAKMASTRRFESDSARDKAAEALGKLQENLQQAHQKLSPLKGVRQDYMNRVAAQRIAQEVLDRLSPAEVDVDKAEEAAVLLPAGGTDQGMKEAEQAVHKATASLNGVLKFIDARRKAATGETIRQELQMLEERARQSQGRLAELKHAQKEVTERKVAHAMMQEATELLQAVSDAVMKASEAEGPFLMGVEDMPLEDTSSAIKTCESAIDAASTAASIARMFVATKMVEAKRFSCKQPSEETVGKLRGFQEVLDGHTTKLQQLKSANATRKNNATIQEAESEVRKAEEATKKVKEAAAMFEKDEEVFRLSAEEIREKTEEIGQAESVADTALAAARKFITARQIEAKGIIKAATDEHTTKLIKFQIRLGTAQQEVGKCNKLVGSVDQRLAARKVVQEATARLETAEEAVVRLTEMVKTIGEEPPAEEPTAEKSQDGAQMDGEAGEKLDAEAGGRKDAEANEKPEQPAPKGFEEIKKEVEEAAADATTALRNAIRYIQLQARTGGAAKDDVGKLQLRVYKVQASWDVVKEDMKERTDKLMVAALLKESEDRVVASEQVVNKVTEVESTLKGDDMTVEEATKSINEIDTVLSSACSVVSGAKTLLAMKRFTVNRLSEASFPYRMCTWDFVLTECVCISERFDVGTGSVDLGRFPLRVVLARVRWCKAVRDQATEPLAEFQTRVDKVADRLAEAQQALQEQKTAIIQKEVSGIIGNVEKEVEAAEEATEGLSDVEHMTADQMKDVVGKVGATQVAAQKALEAALKLLVTRRNDIESVSGSAESSVELIKDIDEQIMKATQLQATVDKQKAALRDCEQKFVAHRLQRDAVEIVDKLEETLKTTTEIVAPLIVSDSENGAIGSFTIVVFMQAIFGMLRKHAKAASKTPAELFGEMVGKSGKVTESQFVAYVTEVMDQQDDRDMVFSDEQQKAVFKSILEEGAEVLTEKAFVGQFTHRYVVQALVTMTDSLAVKGGKTVRKLETGEIMEALEEPAKEESVGIMRVKAKALRDGKTGFITLVGNQGTVYLETYSPNAAKQQKVEKALQDLLTAVKEALGFIEKEVEELKSVRSGPLVEAKAELQNIKPRVLKVQNAHSEMEKQFTAALAALNETLENERRKRAEAAEKKQAAETLDEVTTRIGDLQAEFDKVAPAVEELAKSAGEEEEDPVESFDQALADLEVVVASAEQTATFVKDKMNLCKGIVKGPMNELRSVLVKQKVGVGAMEGKLKKHAAALRDARKKLAADSREAIVNLFKQHVQKTGTSPAQLFNAMSEDGADVPFTAAKKFLTGLEGAKALNIWQLDLGLERYAAGLTKLSLLEMLQDFQVCVRDIAITTAFEVKNSKALKKIAEGDVVELLSVGMVDAACGLPRAQCRMLQDGTEGWVTLKGNQGTTFLTKCTKPYYSFEEEVPMQTAFESSSQEGARKFKAGEVVEVVEGPRKEPPVEVQRVRGKAKKDGKSGWVTLKNADGDEYLELSNMLVCKHSVTLTSFFEIGEGKAFRKLEVGEMLKPIEEKVDEQNKLTRFHVKALKDQKEGWVTIKGNQGTSYVEPNDKLYVCKRRQPLVVRISSGSPSVRDLEEGEVFEVTDGPKTEVKQGPPRVKGRSMTDGAEGWFTAAPKTVLPWSPEFHCINTTALHDGLKAESSATIRKLDKGEFLQAISTPMLDEASGVLRIRVWAKKDGKTGFATLRGDQGTVFLESLSVSSSATKQADAAKKPNASAAAAKPPIGGRR